MVGNMAAIAGEAAVWAGPAVAEDRLGEKHEHALYACRLHTHGPAANLNTPYDTRRRITVMRMAFLWIPLQRVQRIEWPLRAD